MAHGAAGTRTPACCCNRRGASGWAPGYRLRVRGIQVCRRRAREHEGERAKKALAGVNKRQLVVEHVVGMMSAVTARLGVCMRMGRQKSPDVRTLAAVWDCVHGMQYACRFVVGEMRGALNLWQSTRGLLSRSHVRLDERKAVRQIILVIWANQKAAHIPDDLAVSWDQHMSHTQLSTARPHKTMNIDNWAKETLEYTERHRYIHHDRFNVIIALHRCSRKLHWQATTKASRCRPASTSMEPGRCHGTAAGSRGSRAACGP